MDTRMNGLDWPMYAQTMTGWNRMQKLRNLLELVIRSDTPGDFVECGVWRGGSSIFAKGVFVSFNENRSVHLFDSFAGLPRATSIEDVDIWSRMEYVKVSLEEVKDHFTRYDLLDEQSVFFHKGFFRYTLPPYRRTSPSPVISVLRLDGDMYESTIDELYNLYEYVSIGGYVLIDDWTILQCQKAVKFFMSSHGIEDPVVLIDRSSSYWQKTKEVEINYKWYLTYNSTRSVE
jgi:hypothetical protein